MRHFLFTLDPSLAHTEPSSRPITPPPIIAKWSGTCVSHVCCQETYKHFDNVSQRYCPLLHSANLCSHDSIIWPCNTYHWTTLHDGVRHSWFRLVFFFVTLSSKSAPVEETQVLAPKSLNFMKGSSTGSDPAGERQQMSEWKHMQGAYAKRTWFASHLRWLCSWSWWSACRRRSDQPRLYSGRRNDHGPWHTSPCSSWRGLRYPWSNLQRENYLSLKTFPRNNRMHRYRQVKRIAQQ